MKAIYVTEYEPSLGDPAGENPDSPEFKKLVPCEILVENDDDTVDVQIENVRLNGLPLGPMGRSVIVRSGLPKSRRRQLVQGIRRLQQDRDPALALAARFAVSKQNGNGRAQVIEDLVDVVQNDNLDSVVRALGVIMVADLLGED